MKWNFRCPICNTWYKIEWGERTKSYKCTKNLIKTFIPKTPSQQQDAFVDEHDWPTEIEDVVRRSKGNNCTVPKCLKRGDTLDHRLAWTNGGKTSVDNLFPMCTDHNLSKGDKDYNTWLRENRLA